MKLKENKGMTLIALTIILAVLVALAGGVIVYLLNNPQSIPQTPTGEQNNIVNNESTANKNEDNTDVKLTDFVGNYEFAMGPDGPNTIKITSDGEGLKIDWVEGPFNGTSARTIKVKSYKLQGNKLVLEVEGDSSNSIIFKENGKTYYTIEGIENEEGFDYFPIEMTKVTNKTEDNKDVKLKDFVGNYEVVISQDGQYNIEIISEGEKLNFDWTAGHPDFYVDIVEVKEYKLENNKLVVEVEENDIELKCIIFKENGKTYFTIEGIEDEESFVDFPVEMIRK